MPLTGSFHSVDEIVKPPKKRIYHNNGACADAQAVPQPERSVGTGGYHLCPQCEKLTRSEG